MKDLPLRARLVVRTSNMKISRLADYVKTLNQKTVPHVHHDYFSSFTNQIIDLWRCRRQILNSLNLKCLRRHLGVLSIYESMSQRVSAVTQTHKMKAKISEC